MAARGPRARVLSRRRLPDFGRADGGARPARGVRALHADEVTFGGAVGAADLAPLLKRAFGGPDLRLARWKRDRIRHARRTHGAGWALCRALSASGRRLPRRARVSVRALA